MSTSAISEIEIDTTSAKDISNNCIPTSSDNNLWLTILNCHQSQDPPRALINASRSNLRPILTVLAACYEVILFRLILVLIRFYLSLYNLKISCL